MKLPLWYPVEMSNRQWDKNNLIVYFRDWNRVLLIMPEQEQTRNDPDKLGYMAFLYMKVRYEVKENDLGCGEWFVSH